MLVLAAGLAAGCKTSEVQVQSPPTSANPSRATATTAAPRNCTVLYASTDIPRGTPASSAVANAMIIKGDIPEAFRPELAVTGLDRLDGIALFDIPANTVIVENMFVESQVIPKSAATGSSLRPACR